MHRKQSFYLLLILWGIFSFCPACLGNQPKPTLIRENPALSTPQISTAAVEINTDPDRPMEPLPTPTGLSSITVLETQIYPRNLGNSQIVGLVKNTSNQTYSNIQVAVQVFDSSGDLLFVETIPTSISTLSPGGVSPFMRLIQDLPQDVHHAVGTIIESDQAEIDLVEMEIRGVKVTTDAGDLAFITGDLYNPTLNPVRIKSLSAAIFDNSGHLLLANTHSLTVKYLEPGEVGPFRVTISGPNDRIMRMVDYAIYMEADTIPPAEYIDLMLAKETHSYQDSLGSLHLVGEITNHSSIPVTLVLLAAIYDQQANILDASVITLPGSFLSPGETLPYDFVDWPVLRAVPGYLDNAWQFSVQWDPHETTPSSLKAARLETRNNASHVENNALILSGEIINDSGYPLIQTIVIGTISDKNTGKIFVVGYQDFPQEISPGSKISYTLTLMLPDGLDMDQSAIAVMAKGVILE